MSFPPGPAMALLVISVLTAPFSATLQAGPAPGLTATLSGNDLVLSFPTTPTNFYGVRARADLSQPWTAFRAGILGDGTRKSISLTNAISAGLVFYQLSLQPRPVALLLPQSEAFAILGHSCGGIREKVYATGFAPETGYPRGEVFLSTTCSTGGRGSPPATFTAWAAVTWDFAANVTSSAMLSNGPPVDPMFISADPYGDIIYNTSGAAYIIVPVPAAPTQVTATQSGDQFQIFWTVNSVNPAAVISSTLNAVPLNSTSSALSGTVAGPATNGLVASLQPQTTYQVTVVNTTLGGSIPASTPLQESTEPTSIAPSAPAGVAATWANLNPPGTNDTLVATWQAAVPGDSPVDQYEVTVAGSDSAGSFSQALSGTTLSADFTLDYIPNWSVTVRAHNAAGWSPWSPSFTLGGL